MSRMHSSLLGNQSKVIIGDGNGNTEELFMSDIATRLTEVEDDDIKKSIYECWKYNKGAHAYLGSGAARGIEVTRIPQFKHCQYIFGSLRYEMFSIKGESHGVRENKTVVHLLPPSFTRR